MGDGKELGEVDKRKTIIMIYFKRKKFIFSWWGNAESERKSSPGNTSPI